MSTATAKSGNCLNNSPQEVDVPMDSHEDVITSMDVKVEPLRKDQQNRTSTASSAVSLSHKAKIGEESQTYECPCGETFSKSTDFAAHKRWSCKLAEKKCQCDVCKRWFAHEHGLRRHMKQAHGGVFLCDSCDLRFHNKMKLTRHWMEAHYDDKDMSGDKKLKCYICKDVEFDTKYELECHLLAHKYGKETTVVPAANREMPTALGAASSPTPTDSSAQSSRSIPSTHSGNPCYDSTFPRFRTAEGVTNAPFHHHSFPPHVGHRFLHGPFRHHGHPPRFSHGFPGHTFPMPPPPPPPLPPHPPPPFPFQDCPPANPSASASAPPSPFDVPLNHPHPPRFPGQSSPHHNHEAPPYFPCHSYHDMKKFHKHHHKHHNKRKWKHYFKTMMSYMPSYWFGRPESSSWGFHSEPQECNESVSTASDCTRDDMVTCEFCGQRMHSRHVGPHRRRWCPVLCVHKCVTCGRAFGSQRLLLRHMSRQGHMNPSEQNNPVIDRDGDSSLISGLQEKLNLVLNLQGASVSGKGPSLSHASNSNTNTEPDSTRSIPTVCITKASDRLSSEHSGHSETFRLVSECSKKEKCNEGDDHDNVLMIDEDSSNAFVCFVCRSSLSSKNDLQQHLNDHLTHVEAIKKVQEWARKSAEFFSDREHSEDRSGISHETPTDLSSAAASTWLESDSSSNICSTLSSRLTDISETDKWLKPHGKHKRKKPERQLFPCDVCTDVFAFRKDHHLHMAEKHGDHTLECPVCHKTFSWKNRAKFYERHMQSHYGVSVYKYKCHMCDKTFLEKHKLRAHMSTHKAELLHTCCTCGKGYGNKSSLIRHQRKHTGDKPHQCELCTESFWEKRELVRHSATHTGTSPFVCSVCGQGFTLKTSLMKHVKRKHP